jgi:predicted flavoprotein YhiN
MAAEIAADNKLSVVIVDAMPTYGRKFLMAGKSGLNITKNQNKQDFLGNYYNAEHWLTPIINNFDNEAVMNWAQNLGQEIFTGSSGHVFPKTMKASPLLRAWLQRLANKGIKFYHNWKWIGWEENINSFDTKDGKEFIKSHSYNLSFGWCKLVKAWFRWFMGRYIKKIMARKLLNLSHQIWDLKFQWSKHMKPFFGKPIKSVRISSGGFSAIGEFIISKKRH